MSNILATKYRPKKFADMIGQDHAVKILTNTVLNGNLHHAYIFSGKFGCGKTTAARVFAASLNSPKGPTLDPDLSAPNIQAILEGKSHDVMEMDAASNRGIDDIRQLKEQIGFSPLECRYRFVIVDEAHALTGQAAEAALKMIEEPPQNTIFVFCTTDPLKMVPTIRSRCMKVKFNKVHWTTLTDHLCKVAQAENVSFDQDAMKIAARLSQGSVRNSLQNLQTMITFAGKSKITTDLSLTALQAVDEAKFFDLVDAVLGPDGGKPNAGDAYRVIDNLLGDGRDVGEVLDGLVDHFRNLLIISTSPKTTGLINLTEEEKKRYVHQRQRLGGAQMASAYLVDMIDALAESRRQILVNLNPQTVLEKFVVKAILTYVDLQKQGAAT